MHVNEISGQIVDAAIKVHSALGPGLLESSYETCLAHELTKRGFHVETGLLQFDESRSLCVFGQLASTKCGIASIGASGRCCACT
ncbi:MAG: GxxExxY protein [Planctomycetota bacterium]|nr:GxxExxY protein [Planctomycetota bacterium]